MVFSSTIFLCVYLPLVLLGYYICPKKGRNLFLLIASLVFYAWGEPKYVFLMIFSILVNYIFGRLMDEKPRQAKAHEAAARFVGRHRYRTAERV